MNDYPIQTIEKDKEVVKLCTENLTKFRNVVVDHVYKTFDNIVSSFTNWFDPDTGEYLIESKGVAKCTDGDKFDSLVGKEIAFRKVKLAANIKKLRKLKFALLELEKCYSYLVAKTIKIQKYIEKDIEALRKYNPTYSPDCQ